MTALREEFWRDGLAVVRGAATPEWVNRLRESLGSHLASPSDRLKELSSAESGRFVSGHGLLGAMPELGAFLSASSLASHVRGLFDGGPVALIDDQVFAKAPATSDEMPWHQDGSFWPISGDALCTSWLALDEVTPDTGGLEVVLGSHRWNRTFQAVGARRDPQLIDPGHEPLPPDRELRERHRIACPLLGAGDALVFHALTLHRSGPNTSAVAWRRAVVLRWAGGDARFDGRERAAPRARETAERHGLRPGGAFIGAGFPEF
jgi:hypothetical protein